MWRAPAESSLGAHAWQGLTSACLQWDDPLDAIAVHAWNGTWGVIAVGLLAGRGLIYASYGSNPDYAGNFAVNADGSNLPDAPPDFFRQYGCFFGGDGKLLGAQIIYLMWLTGAFQSSYNR